MDPNLTTRSADDDELRFRDNQHVKVDFGSILHRLNASHLYQPQKGEVYAS